MSSRNNGLSKKAAQHPGRHFKGGQWNTIAKNVKATKNFRNDEVSHRPINPSISLEASIALANAEKIVEGARISIVESTHKSNIDFSPEVSDVDNLDEEELNIRNIVSKKFDGANRRKKSVLPERVFPSHSRSAVPNPDPRFITRQNGERKECLKNQVNKPTEECKKCSEKITKEKKFDNKLSSTCSIKKCPSVNIRNELSLVSVDKYDIMPKTNPSSPILKNIHSYEFRHESCDSKTDSNLIDVGVQTNLPDLTKSLLKPEETEDRELQIDPNQNSPGPVASVHHEKGNDVENIQRHERIKLKGTFIDFLCRVSEVDKNQHGDENKNDQDVIESVDKTNLSPDKFRNPNTINDFDLEKINLEPPKLKSLDKILINLDEKIKSITQSTESFGKMYLDQEILKSKPILNKHRDNVDNDDELKVILRPRTFSASSSCMSSEIFLPPARYSTPLNNESLHIHQHSKSEDSKKNSNNFLISMSESALSDPNITPHEVMTRLSSSLSDIKKTHSTMEKKSSVHELQKKTTHFSSLNSENDVSSLRTIETVSFPSYSSQKYSESLKSLKSKISSAQKFVVDAAQTLCHKENDESSKSLVSLRKTDKSITLSIKNESINHSIAENKQLVHDPEEHNKTNLHKKNLNNKADNTKEKGSKYSEISEGTKESNITGGSSIRDRTSYDVSGILSESSKASINHERVIEIDTNAEKQSTEFRSGDSAKEIGSCRAQVILLDDEKIEIDQRTQSVSLQNENKINDGAFRTFNLANLIRQKLSSPFAAKQSVSDESKDDLERKSPLNLAAKSENQIIKAIEDQSSTRISSSFSSSSSSSLSSASASASASVGSKPCQTHKKSQTEDYSEGELFLPSSCSYSMGEIRFSRIQSPETDVACINLSVKSPVQSLGEMFSTSTESNTVEYINKQIIA